jgi:hypothetical protein
MTLKVMLTFVSHVLTLPLTLASAILKVAFILKFYGTILVPLSIMDSFSSLLIGIIFPLFSLVLKESNNVKGIVVDTQ